MEPVAHRAAMMQRRITVPIIPKRAIIFPPLFRREAQGTWLPPIFNLRNRRERQPLPAPQLDKKKRLARRNSSVPEYPVTP